MPHAVAAPAALFLSDLQRQQATLSGTRRSLLQQTTAQQQFAAADAMLTSVLTEELSGAAVGATLSLAAPTLAAQYLSILPDDLVRDGATCGAFILPPASTLNEPAEMVYVLAKAQPPDSRPWAMSTMAITTDAHALITLAFVNGTAEPAAPTLRPVADMPRSVPLPADPDMRSHCVALVDARWQRSVSIGAGMEPQQEYLCDVEVMNADPVAVVAVEDAELVVIDDDNGPNPSVLLIIIIVLLCLLALLIAMLVTVHYMRLRRARLHRIRIANAEKGECLLAAPIAVGGKHFCFASNMRTLPELVLFEEAL